MNRVLQLRPITELEGDAFFKAWVDCVRGHYTLWETDIQRQRSPSLEHLAYHEEGNVVHGILIDWDLPAHNLGDVGPAYDHLERDAENIPFMPLSLLVLEYWEGQITGTYEHDVETFVWILVWVFMRYENAKVAPDPPLQAWLTGDWLACGENKNYFLRNRHKKGGLTDMQNCWKMQAKLAYGLPKLVSTRVTQAEESPFESCSPEDVYQLYWDVMKEYRPITDFI